MDSHLHMFMKGKTFYSIPHEEDLERDLDETQYTIADLLAEEGQSIEYMYDMGDDWAHKLTLKKITDEAPQRPACLDGKRACPPEDIGGSFGYTDFLKALDDPEHDMHEEYTEWIGGEFDAEEFYLEETNEILQEL